MVVSIELGYAMCVKPHWRVTFEGYDSFAHRRVMGADLKSHKFKKKVLILRKNSFENDINQEKDKNSFSSPLLNLCFISTTATLVEMRVELKQF